MTYQDLLTTAIEGKQREGARLMDVRERDEYLAGHMPGAVNLPPSELMGREDEIGSSTVPIRANGNRSSQAAAYLVSQRKDGPMNLSGGTVAWMREGRDLTRGRRP